jgi:trans-aconitate 2-methyltransferase
VDAKTFYDEYVDRQVSVGINERHCAFLGWLQRFGGRGNSVREVGCGVGTVTELLARAIGPDGSVVAIDLSPKSIEAARERLAAFRNVKLIAGDVLTCDLDRRFDVVLLPEVIEHIPLESHGALFELVARWAARDGFVLLHYPNPHHLEWCHEHQPEQLQLIDQPVHADVLLSHACAHGLYLDYFQVYSIWIREGHYVVALMRSRSAIDTFTPRRSPAIPARPGRGSDPEASA